MKTLSYHSGDLQKWEGLTSRRSGCLIRTRRRSGCPYSSESLNFWGKKEKTLKIPPFFFPQKDTCSLAAAVVVVVVVEEEEVVVAEEEEVGVACSVGMTMTLKVCVVDDKRGVSVLFFDFVLFCFVFFLFFLLYVTHKTR